MTNLEQTGEKVLANVERVIVGKHHEVRLALVALLCRGHLLIEDVPGTGKTVLAKAIARSLGCSFRRIQFTPDLLPSDVTGLSIYNQKNQEFEFRPGPIMAQVVLADEINRATPKTQSALLECMEERQATIDGTTYAMPDPFLVIATQNPIEYEGTFALPEAQLDRFMLRIRLGYPQPIEEVVILDEQKRTHPLEDIEVVCSVDEMRGMQTAVRDVYVDSTVAAHQKLAFGIRIGITELDREQKAVELRFRQWIRADLLDRILRGDDEEWIGQLARLSVHRYLALFHRFEQRALRLRRRAVDLVGQHDRMKNRTR